MSGQAAVFTYIPKTEYSQKLI